MIGKKIECIAETIKGYSVIFDSKDGANVDLNKTKAPVILIYPKPSGEVNATNEHYRDSGNYLIVFSNKKPRDYNGEEVEKIEACLKKDMFMFIQKLKKEPTLKLQSEKIPYTVGYNEFNNMFIGVMFTINISERVGTSLACE